MLKKGYKVFGTYRRLSTPNFWRLHYLDVYDKVELIPSDILDTRSISEALVKSNPSEVYHLAAQSFVGVSFDQPLYTSNVTGFGVVRILEEIMKFNQKIKFYQASSSEMYGEIKSKIKNEETCFHPVSPYAVAKTYGYWMVRLYRDAYNIHASNGILFNHESPLRGLEFVTRKITNSAARIKLGLQKKLNLGHLESYRDWGYAPEYVEGMWKILQQKQPDDFVLATNETHSVREFVEAAFSSLDLDWKKYVKTDKKFYRVLEVNLLKGDAAKAQKKLSWKPKTKFKKLVKIMVEKDLERWNGWKNGERFPWDADNYIGDDKTLFRKAI